MRLLRIEDFGYGFGVDTFQGKLLENVYEHGILRTFSEDTNNYLKKDSLNFIKAISEETFYKIYPHMLLLQEFYKEHKKLCRKFIFENPLTNFSEKTIL
jgi:hypothetical protein